MDKVKPFHEYQVVKLAECTDRYGNEQGQLVFEWLKQEAKALKGNRALPCDGNGKPWVEQHGREVKFSSWVGTVRTPCGAQIEILPKSSNTGKQNNTEAYVNARRQFMQMLLCLPEMQHIRPLLRSLVDTQMNVPLGDVFLAAFLRSVSGLIGQGMRRGYVQVEGNMPALRGRLCMAAHLRHNLIRRERFYTRHDRFTADRAENRVIHTALRRALTMVGTNANRSLANHLLVAFDDVPLSTDIDRDMGLTRRERDMHYYYEALAWAQFILKDLFPLTSQTPGRENEQREAAFMLFPMEIVFEKAVALALARQMPDGYTLKEQVASRSLFSRLPKGPEQQAQQFLSLRPDMVVVTRDSRACMMLDTKWKRVTDRSDRWIDPQDMYQMKAYGDNYLGEKNGPVVLVYPRTDSFKTALPPLIFNSFNGNMENRLQLWRVPFCLDRHILVLPAEDGKDAGLPFHSGKELPPPLEEDASRPPLGLEQFVEFTHDQRYKLGLDMG